jgi:hypothetical protein
VNLLEMLNLRIHLKRSIPEMSVYVYAFACLLVCACVRVCVCVCVCIKMRQQFCLKGHQSTGFYKVSESKLQLKKWEELYIILWHLDCNRCSQYVRDFSEKGTAIVSAHCTWILWSPESVGYVVQSSWEFLKL